MKKIPLTGRHGQGKFMVVDDQDFAQLNNFKWHVSATGYARTCRAGKHILAHHLVRQPGAGLVIDHVNQNKLDNRRSNLRVATRGQNNTNRPWRSKTGYRGVERSDCKKKLWSARIRKGDTRYYLGTFDSPIQAAKAFNAAALELHGEFAVLNDV
jgi:hypothetical protein